MASKKAVFIMHQRPTSLVAANINYQTWQAFIRSNSIRRSHKTREKVVLLKAFSVKTPVPQSQDSTA